MLGHDQNSQTSIRLLSTIFCIGVTLGSGLGYGLIQVINLIPSKAASTFTQRENQTLGFAEYIRLEPGMTLAQVESILGRGVEIESSETTMNYTWRNASGSSINAFFKDGKLVKKNQVGLEVANLPARGC